MRPSVRDKKVLIDVNEWTELRVDHMYLAKIVADVRKLLKNLGQEAKCSSEIECELNRIFSDRRRKSYGKINEPSNQTGQHH